MSSRKSNENCDVIQKTREEVKAGREAKKAAKIAAKVAKSKANKTNGENKSTNNTTPVANNNIPETSINHIKKKKESNFGKVDVKNEPSERIDQVSQSQQIVETDATDLTSNVKDNMVVTDAFKQDAVPSPNVVTNGSFEGENEAKSKAKLRAERRAKQETQRAAKQQQSLGKSNSTPQPVKQAAKQIAETVSESSLVKRIAAKSAVNAHEINLFKHLYHERENLSVKVAAIDSRIHPAITKLGIQYAKKIVVGSNARCVALLAATKQVIHDFEKPAQADFVRGLETTLQESETYLHHCRPLAVSMQNAMRHLKRQMTQFSPTLSDDEAKHKLQGIIDTYIKEQIELADQAISLTIQSKISNGNVILTYGYSSLIHKILVDAHTAGKQFRVIVVDGRPWLEGKEMLRRLAKHGLECSYILINALSFIMPEVSKVFLGAHAILANGAVMSRAGTAQVALIARTFNVPVLVACETHKSCERVQTDSIVYNELGNADELVNKSNSNSDQQKKSVLSNWQTKKSLNLLNLTYDVTPADLVTAVVTELAILPCTSVPVILRIKPSEI